MMHSKTIRISLLDVYLGVICIFPISTMLVEGSIWNKVMFGVLLVTNLAKLFSGPIKKKTLWLLAWLIIHYIFVFSKTSFPMENANLLFYYPFFLLYTYFMTDNIGEIMGWFAKNRKYVKAIMNIWTVLVGISIFLPSSYYIREGGHSYFGSFCGSIFRLGPSAVFIQVLTLMSQTIYRERKAFFYMMVPMYSVLMGSARTYLVIGFCLFVISWYVFCRKKKVFWGTIIPLSLGVLALVSVSAMGNKIAFTLDESQYGDFWFRITSSRSKLWAENISAWKEAGILEKILGAGLEFSIETTNHWAHNDFIEILCSFGIIGLLQYLSAMRGLYRRGYGNARIPFAVKTCAFMVWFFNACFNMHYVYFCAMLCYPLLVFTLKQYFDQNPAELKWKNETNETTNRIYPHV